MAATTRRFKESQIFFLEQAFNDGLTSTSLVKYNDKYRDLEAKTGLEIKDIQRWINNRNRGPRPLSQSSGLAALTDIIENDGEKANEEKSKENPGNDADNKIYRKPPPSKPACGYAIFCGKIFHERQNGKLLKIKFFRILLGYLYSFYHTFLSPCS